MLTESFPIGIKQSVKYNEHLWNSKVYSWIHQMRCP